VPPGLLADCNHAPTFCNVSPMPPEPRMPPPSNDQLLHFHFGQIFALPIGRVRSPRPSGCG
jgi:hypothetical protein